MQEMVEELAEIVLRVRAHRPLVHYLPNWVTANDVANVLLAVGASPVMAVAAEEVCAIASDAVGLNLGTPTTERIGVLEAAGVAATTRGVPVVLDPVGAGVSAFRLAGARRLLAALPSAILRLNAGEAAALLQTTTQTGLTATGAVYGVDVAGPPTDNAGLARLLARRYQCVAAVTGPCDGVSDGERILIIDSGDPLLMYITGAGCMLTGLVAACAAVEPDRFLATAAALLGFGVAAEVAARGARGPGSFRPALVDALYSLDRTTLLHKRRVRWC